MTEIRKRNSEASDKLSFLDDIYIEEYQDGYVAVGLKEDVGHQNGDFLSLFRFIKVNPRRK